MAEQNKRILKDFLDELIKKFNGHRSDISSEDVLEQFMAWAEARGTTLYPAQEEAILELLDEKNVIAKHHCAAIITNKFFAQNKSLSKSVWARLNLVAQVKTHCRAIPQQTLKIWQIRWSRDNENVTNAR